MKSKSLNLWSRLILSANAMVFSLLYNPSVLANNLGGTPVEGSTPQSISGVSDVVTAEQVVEAINNGASNAPSAVEGTSQVSDAASSAVSNSAGEVIQQIQGDLKNSSVPDALSEINNAVNTQREASKALAFEFASPIGYVLMMGANILWYLSSFYYFWHTAVDVICIVTGSPFVFAVPRETDGTVTAILRSMFKTSWDYDQTMQELGLGGQATGHMQAGAAVGAGGMQGAGMNGMQGGMQGGAGMNGMQGGMQGGMRGQRPPRGTAFGIYFGKRMKTLIFLGFTLAIFMSSLALDIQANLIAVVLSIGRALWNVVRPIFGL